MTAPTIADLPIHAHREELLAAIAAHPVVVVAGETGSGKSTQLPQLCLELGRGELGLIAHTQPRRIAARSIAERVAEELGTHVGERVGYQVRFTDEESDATELKVMTDGILLAEIQRDRELRRYSTIIIDEAHERSLNIDFLLGWLHELLQRRDDLKLIITSATIDTERFSQHFDNAPVIEVSGRSYPVEVRYRPPERGADQADAIVAAVQELWREPGGDILVFCSGEREIRDAVDALSDADLGGPRPVEVVPLFGRLSATEQHRVFAPHNTRRIVVATNVAETSLTVPGIRYVVDTGTARISRFNRRTKVQRLPIEAISQASANQRAGRCGRVAPGICIRLYSEEDFLGRPEFTEPEIQRTNLASVILQMAAAGLGDVEEFSFVDPPDPGAIADGIVLLEELGAVRPDRRGRRNWITGTGRTLARLPLDPRLGRMLIEAHRRGCLEEVKIIVAALSIQDPRERPLGEEAAADACHHRFADPESDLLAWLHLWDHLAEARRDRTSSAFRRLCRQEYIHHLRVREWQDLHAQLGRLIRRLDWKPPAAAPDASGGRGARRRGKHGPDTTVRPSDRIHQAILAGLLSHVALKRPEGREYTGARNSRLMIAPGSSLFKASPKWIMAAELVETNRLWARQVARVQPAWIEDLGADQTRHSFGETWWDETEGAAKVHHSITLYGLPVATNRTELLHRHDRDEARYLFLSNALVDGRWGTRRRIEHHFVEANAAVLQEVADLEIRSRRDDLRVTHDTLVAWFDERVDASVATVTEFDRWWRRVRRDRPDLLTLRPDDVLAPTADAVDAEAYPETWRGATADAEADLTYVHDPGHTLDGIVVEVPLGELAAFDPREFDWLVPGLRTELIEGLLRTLPKPLRKALMPLPARAAQVAAVLDPEEEPDLRSAVARVLGTQTGLSVAADDMDLDRLPGHLRPHFRIADRDGTTLAEGPDLIELRTEIDRRLHGALAALGHPLQRSGMTAWDCDRLPETVTTVAAGYELELHPSLVDEGDTVGVALWRDPVEAAEAHWEGVRRLLSLQRGSLSAVLRPLLTNDVKLALVLGPHDGPRAWLDDCVDAALEAFLVSAGPLPRDAVTFGRWAEDARRQLPDRVAEIATASAEVLVAHRELVTVSGDREGASHPAIAAAVADVERQREALVYPGFIAAVAPERLLDVARYLRAAAYRLERVVEAPERDRASLVAVRELEQRWEQLDDAAVAGQDAEEIGWLLQELRVQEFAQHLGTRQRVSLKRVRRALDAISPAR